VSLATALAAVGGWRYARASAPVSGPIVVVSIDSLRADHLPAYGYEAIRTPAIDALAADGIVFERAYSNVPQTLPAHVSVLSGRLPFDTGVRGNAGFAVKPSERLLAEILRDRGYETGGVVSSYLLRKETGIEQGFSFFDGVSPDGTPESLQRDGAVSVEVAAKWLESAGTDRAFLFLHLAEPHAPYTPPSPYDAYHAYDGEIAYADELVGRFVRHLKSRQLYDQSTIVLLSDHGEGLGDHGEKQHGVFVYENTLRVPFIIKPAASQVGGRRIAVAVQHVDIVPTILDLAKAPFPDGLRGRSLKPLLEGAETLGNRAIYSESLAAYYRFGWSPLATVTDGRFRLLVSPHPALYDLDTDPAQENPLPVSEEPARQLQAAHDRLVPDSPADAPADLIEVERERLAQLGFAGVAADPPTDPDPSIDPRDKSELIAGFDEAADLAAIGRWPAAIERLQTLVRTDPRVPAFWSLLASVASKADRNDAALDAYRQLLTLTPARASAHAGLTAALLRQRRYDDARRQAELAEQLDPSLPVGTYVDARALYDRGHYEEALPLFELALEKAGDRALRRWRFYTAETLSRLYRYEEAEHRFLEELKAFPQDATVRAALAVFYHSTGRAEDAAAALADLVRLSPTPEGYALAARTWTAIGNPHEAAAARAEARRTAQ